MQQPYSWKGVTNSYMAPDWNSYMERLQQAEQQLTQMSEKVSSLQKQLDEIKSKPPLHIEYHFDQLKVNHLEGTLNVGLTPQGIQDLESFDVPSAAAMNPQPIASEEPEPPISDLQTEMFDYMNHHSYRLLVELEKEWGVQLESSHRDRVVQDVKKQLDARVHYYARTSTYPPKGTEAERLKWKESIKERTARDIRGAFSSYIQKLHDQTTAGSVRT
jgi:spore germination protein PC